MIINRHLYLTEDGSRVVEEGDPAGRWLHWSPGKEVADSEYERLTRHMRPPTGRPKRHTPSSDKAKRPTDNK